MSSMQKKEPTHEPARMIYQRMRERNLNNFELARLIEVSPTTIGNLYSGKVHPSPETLSKLARVLDLNEATLLRLADYLNATPNRLTDPLVIELAHKIEALPENSRIQLVQQVHQLVQMQDKQVATEVAGLATVIKLLAQLCLWLPEQRRLYGSQNETELIELVQQSGPEIVELAIERAANEEKATELAQFIRNEFGNGRLQSVKATQGIEGIVSQLSGSSPYLRRYFAPDTGAELYRALTTLEEAEFEAQAIEALQRSGTPFTLSPDSESNEAAIELLNEQDEQAAPVRKRKVAPTADEVEMFVRQLEKGRRINLLVDALEEDDPEIGVILNERLAGLASDERRVKSEDDDDEGGAVVPVGS